MVKNLPANARDERDVGSIPGLGRSLGIATGNPLQYSCLENSTGRGDRWPQTLRLQESDVNEHNAKAKVCNFASSLSQ